MADHGIETLVIMTGDSDDEVAERMVRAHRRLGTRRPDVPSWTTDPPAWWSPTHTVALRRSMPSDQRAVWLGYRRRAG